MRNASVYQLKPGFQSLLRPLARSWAQAGNTANQLTALGLVAAALSGCAVALAVLDSRWLFAVPALLLIRMACNALDGMVAREHGQASARGRVFNEMADVVGDAVSYLPFALLFRGAAALVIVVVVLGLLTEFAALLDPEQRRNEGPMGKSDRAALFALIAVVGGLTGSSSPWVNPGLALAAIGLLATLRNRLRSVR